MAHGHGHANINSYADAFVFDEMGVTFSVYPDGEFDFYLGDACQPSTMSNGYVSATFNSGYDYNPYVQYDDFGAVVQVENVPVWYDYYGRVTQIGDVDISYRNRRVCQVGGMYVNYNRHGHYAFHTGFINRWNPYFVYRPFYVSFARPVVNLCFVRTTPYRQYYAPVRYSYYRPYVRNVRPHYATIGHTYRPSSGRGVVHSSYRQSAGRGEVAFKRERRTVTTASVRQQTMNLNTGRAASQQSTNVVPNTSTQRANTNRVTAKPRTGSNVTTRQTTSTRSTKPATPQRATYSSVNRGTATRTAPTRNSSSTVSRSTSRPATSTQSRSTSRTSTAVKPSSNSRQTSSSRGSVRSTPSRSSSSARTQTSRSTHLIEKHPLLVQH